MIARVFLPPLPSDAAKGPMALLSSSSVRTLAYVFGGDRPRGSVLPSPHMGQRGKFIILRRADGPRQHARPRCVGGTRVSAQRLRAN